MSASKGKEEFSPGAAHALAARSYWSIVRQQYRKNRLGMVGLRVFQFLVVVALLAPLLANEVPILARYKGDLHFPAFTTYLDCFPIPNVITDPLRRFQIGDYNPFSEFYPELEGRTWKRAIAEDFDSERGDWYVPPPVFFGYKEVGEFKRRPGTQEQWGKQSKFTSTHWLGTDGKGRDVLARIIHGTIISLSVGVVAVAIYVAIGIALGLAAGYFGGWADMFLSRLTEVVICFPTFFLIITVISFLPRSIYNIMVVIGLFSWPGVFRLIRGEVLKVKALDYTAAAQALGLSPWRIMFRHLLVNAVSPVFVVATFGVATAIITETSLSFLGFGVAPPTPSWGDLAQEGREYIGEGLFYLTIAPGIAIFVTVTTFNLIGQALRDAIDPSLRH